MYTSSVIFFISSLAKKFPKQLLLLICLLIMESVLIASSVLAIIPFADLLIDPNLNNPNKVTKWLINLSYELKFEINFLTLASIFIFSNILKSVFSLIIFVQIFRIKYSIEKSLAIEILNNILLSKWSFFNNLTQGKIMNTLTVELQYIGSGARILGEVFSIFFQVITYLAIPFYLSPELTIKIILLIILLGLPFLLLNNFSRKIGKKRAQAGNEYIGKLDETLQAAKIILGFGRTKKTIKSLTHSLDKQISAGLKSQTVNAAPNIIFKPIAVIGLIMVFGSTFDLNIIPQYAAVFWSLYGALPLIGRAMHSTITISNYQASYEQVEEIISRAKNHVEISGREELNKSINSIIFKDVSFKYDEKNMVIKNCSFEIKKNKITALVGSSGGGKSTIIDLLLGLQVSESGQILINNHDIKNLNLSSLRKKIGYVPQDPILFYTTIRENLLWANPAASEEEIFGVLRKTHSLDFIMKLTNKIDTIVGQRGLQISGGQRQRIALARALITKPELIILDEATSSIDSHSEFIINETLKEISKYTTILMSAHTLSVIKNADNIISIKNGETKLVKDFSELQLK